MNIYYYQSKSIKHQQENFVEAESISKARYIIWLKGASEYYKNFIDFFKRYKNQKSKQRIIRKGKIYGEYIFSRYIK